MLRKHKPAPQVFLFGVKLGCCMHLDIIRTEVNTLQFTRIPL